MTEPSSALAVLNVSKSYPGVVALRDVSVSFSPGRVHALLGENGAGKSTLTKIIAGTVQPDSGVIVVGGEEISGWSPRRSARSGIAVIHQERQIAFDLSVAENVLLGRMPTTRAGTVDWPEAHRRAGAALQQVGLTVETHRGVRDLTIAQLQILEVARALALDARVLMMDEPTSALTGSSIDQLFDVIRRLRERGVAIVYISHHLDEIEEIADDVTVLRDGRLIVTAPASSMTRETLIETILGKKLAALDETAGEPERLDGADRTVVVEDATFGSRVRGVSFSARAGEIVCVTGGLGSGRVELARLLAGIYPVDSGTVTVKGELVSNRIRAVRAGVAFIPEDRKHQGLMLTRSIADNIALGDLARGTKPFVSPSRVTRVAREMIARVGIKAPSERVAVGQLSGGNQQKVILARWLTCGADVFILDEPTAGIDLGAKAEIYILMRELADKGATVVIFSSDHEEIKRIADRAIVLRRGIKAGELAAADISPERLMALGVNRRGSGQTSS